VAHLSALQIPRIFPFQHTTKAAGFLATDNRMSYWMNQALGYDFFHEQQQMMEKIL
jgi:hypothetical protein